MKLKITIWASRFLLISTWFGHTVMETQIEPMQITIIGLKRAVWCCILLPRSVRQMEFACVVRVKLLEMARELLKIKVITQSKTK